MSTIKENYTEQTHDLIDADTCQLCHGMGFILAPEKRVADKYGTTFAMANQSASLCPKCRGTQAKIVRAQKHTDIPASYQTATMKDFRWDIYGDDHKLDGKRKLATSFIENFDLWKERGRGLYLFSQVRGSGKSYLASCLMNTLLERQSIKDGRFVMETDLIPYSEQNRLDELIDASLLIIDDAGLKQNGAGWLSEIYFRIVDTRLHEKKPMIITANMPLEQLPFDDRTADRLNATLVSLHMPELCVRSIDAKKETAAFLKELGF